MFPIINIRTVWPVEKLIDIVTMRMKLNRLVPLVGFALLVKVSVVWAISAATPEQVLCAYDNIVLATVIEASATKCYTSDDNGNCIYSANSIDVILKIDDVIANKGSTRIAGAIVKTPKIGDVYSGTIHDNIPLPELVARERNDEILKLIHEHRYPPSLSETELSKKADIRNFFIGKQFIFGLVFMDKNPLTFFSIAWLPDRRSWIVDELRKEHHYECATL